MVIFDYIYFRVAKHFFKKDGTSAPRANCRSGSLDWISSLYIGQTPHKSRSFNGHSKIYRTTNSWNVTHS